MATEGESSSYVKPKTLKECIILVLQEAGPGGLTVKEIVQRIKKKKWWDWKNDEAGYYSVSAMCGEPRYREIFVHVAPGTFAMRALQHDDFIPYEKPAKPRTLKEAIIRVLQKAGPGGLTVTQIVQRIKEKNWWYFANDWAAYYLVSNTCSNHSDVFVFVKHSPGLYALRSLQEGKVEVEEAEGSSKALAKEKARDVERIASGSAKRTREAANESGNESNQTTTTTKKKKVEEKRVEEPPSDPVPVVEEKRLLLYTNEQKAAADAWFDQAFEQARRNKLQEIEKGSSPSKRK